MKYLLIFLLTISAASAQVRVTGPASDLKYEDMVLEGTDGTGNGFLFYNRVHDVTLNRVKASNFRIGLYFADNNKIDADNSNLTVLNSEFCNNKAGGFLGGGDNLLMDNVKFCDNGSHNIYLSGGNYPSIGDKVSRPSNNVELRNVQSYDSDQYDDRIGCHEVSIVAHGMFDGLLFDNVTVIEDSETVGGGCWGIAVDQGHPYEEYFKNLVVINSYIENAGNMFLGCTNCTGALFKDTMLVMNRTKWTATGLRVPSKRKQGPSGRIPDEDAEHPTTSITVDGVTVRITDPQTDKLIIGVDLYHVPNATIKNTKVFFDSGNVQCFNVNDNAVMENNYCGPEADYEPTDNIDKVKTLLQEALLLLEQ